MDERSERIHKSLTRFYKKQEKPVSSGSAKKKRKSKWVSEEKEQLRLVTVLRKLGLLFMHAPMGGGRSVIAAARMKRMGSSKGFPDLVIYNTPPNAPNKKGAVIELKRARPAPSRVSPEQRQWLDKLDENGYACRVCYGCDDALEFLSELGFISPTHRAECK